MDLFIKFLLSWGPIILLIVVWVVLLKKFYGKRQSEYMSNSIETMKNIEQTLTRIAIAIERQNEKNL